LRSIRIAKSERGVKAKISSEKNQSLLGFSTPVIKTKIIDEYSGGEERHM
jgi:hypothetical protein